MTETIKISDLIQDDKNANKGSERGQEMIETSFKKLGAGRSVLLDKNGRIIAGNKSIMAAGAAGLQDVVLVRTKGDQVVAVMREDLDLDEPKARELAIADNRTAEVSLDWDIDAVGDFDGDLSWMFEDWELEELGLGDEPPAPGDAEPQINRADELKKEWGTELGQLWRLPSRTEGQEHRLICGDCTDADVVERVMGGGGVNFILTDPIYGVAYSGQNNTMFYGGQAGKPQKTLKGDADLKTAISLIQSSLSLVSAPMAFVWCAPQYHDEAKKAVIAAGFSVFSVIVWNKNHANFGAMGATYKPKYEMALACKVGNIRFFGEANEVTVWDCDRKSKNDLHPTEKPIPIFERAIKNHTLIREFIYDPFLGSGTTIIAAENLSRQCRAVEISPAYVAVALQRYKDAFDITPELITD